MTIPMPDRVENHPGVAKPRNFSVVVVASSTIDEAATTEQNNTMRTRTSSANTIMDRIPWSARLTKFICDRPK